MVSPAWYSLSCLDLQVSSCYWFGEMCSVIIVSNISSVSLSPPDAPIISMLHSVVSCPQILILLFPSSLKLFKFGGGGRGGF